MGPRTLAVIFLSGAQRIVTDTPPTTSNSHDNRTEHHMANTVDITEASFSDNVLNNEKTVLVDFWAPWCGPCKAIAPVLDEIAGQHPDTISVAKVDIDANPGIAQTYQVLSIPTIIVFRGGEPVKRITGAKSKKAILKALVDYMG